MVVIKFKFIKKILYSKLSCDNYLRIVQNCFFLLYKIGILKCLKEFEYHYYVKRMIKKGDTVIDIGSNLGYYSILFAQWVGKSGKVYSVEPVSIYNKIFWEKAKKYKNITLFPYALGDKEQEVELVSPISAGYLRTGLSHIYNSEKDSSDILYGFRTKAEMKIASNLFKQIPGINYIKLDIEGYEYIVLSDLAELIKINKPIIQVELNDSRIKSLLYELGYYQYKVINKKLVRIESENMLKGDSLFLPDIENP